MKCHQGVIVCQHPLSLFHSALFSLSCRRLSSHSLFFYLPHFSFSYSSFSPLPARWLKLFFPLFHSPLPIVLHVSSSSLSLVCFLSPSLFSISPVPSFFPAFLLFLPTPSHCPMQSLSHYHPSILLLSSSLLCLFYIPFFPSLLSFLFFP